MTDPTTPLLAADHETIQKILPHRYPFLLVDRVRDIDPYKSAVGIKNVTFNEPFFQGHFPGHPVMPGVLIIEAMGQTSVVLLGLSSGLAEEQTVYLTTVDKAKFRRPIVPGDVVELHIKAEKVRSRLGRFTGRAIVDGEVAAEAVFSAMLQVTKPASES